MIYYWAYWFDSKGKLWVRGKWESLTALNAGMSRIRSENGTIRYEVHESRSIDPQRAKAEIKSALIGQGTPLERVERLHSYREVGYG